MAIELNIDPGQVENYIMTLAQYGAHGETGVWRLAYTPEWQQAQDQFATWFEEAGLTVHRDAVGNVWGRLEGSAGGKTILSGSHVDSVMPGGRYDGVLGVISPLVALKTLKEQFGTPKRTLEVVAFCEEESSRFSQARHWGSRAVAGAIEPEALESIVDFEGTPIGQAMRDVGLDPDAVFAAIRDDIDIFIELHIEQGPILEEQGVPVAIVDAISGSRHYVIDLIGRADHAGARPMDLRLDPMAGAAEIISTAINTAHRMGRPAVTTCGIVNAEPNTASVVPGKVHFTIDARHPDPEQRELLYARHEATFREVASRRGLDISWDLGAEQPPRASDPELVSLFQQAATEQDVPFITMQSGAVHDANRMAGIARMVMLFVQSKDGRSHTAAEFTSIEHAVEGIRVLTAGLHQLAY